ncbi:MAG TPA: MXAN_5187 C-terminal domain-containing protein, partial [Polyangia bacterium]
MKKAGAFTFQITREGIEARLGEMEKKMDRLRSMYESYFMGMERTPPNTPRRDMNRMMLEMQQVAIGNSSLRFRFQSLSQRWVLQTTYWNRTMREIEAGTFRRDVARTQRHLAERGGIITEEEALALGIPKNRVKAFVARQQRIVSLKTSSEQRAMPSPDASTTAPAAAPSPRPGPPPIPAFARRSPNPDASPAVPAAPALTGLADGDFEGVYQNYMDAHRKLGIEAQAVSKEKLRQRLGRQLPKILEAHGCQRVRLEIAVDDGKVR